MDYINFEQAGRDVVVLGVRNFCLADILECGQSFRFSKQPDGHYSGIAFDTFLDIREHNDTLVFANTSLDTFRRVWYNYFDFARDYDDVKRVICVDEAMTKAVNFTPGMRVLNQEPWEALCSFIFSQNNNIKRIRGLVASFCELFGEKIDGGYCFPKAEFVAKLTVDDLAPIRSGFRAKYVLDAARRVASGDIDFANLETMPLIEASLELQKINGVGPKVAACALLCGLKHADSIPVDVWISRALKAYYPNGMPENIREYAGLAQQYLFHYVRNTTEVLELLAK